MPNTTTMQREQLRNATFFVVPAGTRATMCKGSTCGRLFYWVTNPRTGAVMPISVDVAGGQVPSEHVKDDTQESLFGDTVEHHDGRGVLHHLVCPDVDEFKRGRR
jgi:hypothetical protein